MIGHNTITKKWPIRKLGKVVEFLDSQRIPVKASERIPGPYPYYGANGQQDSVNDYIFDEPTVLLAEDGGHFGDPNRPIAYSVSGKYWVNNHAHVLRPGPEVELRYLTRLLENYDVTPFITGTTRAKLNQRSARDIPIPLPPLAEQQRIAAILDKADALRAKRRAALAKLDALLQSTFLGMFGEAHKFRLVKVEDVASPIRYALSSGPFGSSLTSAHYKEDGVIVLRGLNVSSGTLDLSDVKYISEEKAKSLIRSEVKPKDIVIVAVGASGQAFQIPLELPRAIMSQNFNKITPDTNIIDPTYLEYSLNSLYVQRQFHREITDTVRTFLSLTKIKQVKIPLPLLEKQKEFTRIAKQVGHMKSIQQHFGLGNLDILFHSLQQRAFKGEL